MCVWERERERLNKYQRRNTFLLLVEFVCVLKIKGGCLWMVTVSYGKEIHKDTQIKKEMNKGTQ